jgi:hypothetical protein
MTPLEQRLSETPHRELPPGLRARILAAARPRPSFPALVLALLKNIFSFPHPMAWAAVAAGWAAIAILNFSGPRGPELYTVTPKDYRLLASLEHDVFAPQPAFPFRRMDLERPPGHL